MEDMPELPPLTPTSGHSRNSSSASSTSKATATAALEQLRQEDEAPTPDKRSSINFANEYVKQFTNRLLPFMPELDLEQDNPMEWAEEVMEVYHEQKAEKHTTAFVHALHISLTTDDFMTPEEAGRMCVILKDAKVDIDADPISVYLDKFTKTLINRPEHVATVYKRCVSIYDEVVAKYVEEGSDDMKGANEFQCLKKLFVRLRREGKREWERPGGLPPATYGDEKLLKRFRACTRAASAVLVVDLCLDADPLLRDMLKVTYGLNNDPDHIMGAAGALSKDALLKFVKQLAKEVEWKMEGGYDDDDDDGNDDDNGDAEAKEQEEKAAAAAAAAAAVPQKPAKPVRVRSVTFHIPDGAGDLADVKEDGGGGGGGGGDAAAGGGEKSEDKGSGAVKRRSLLKEAGLEQQVAAWRLNPAGGGGIYVGVLGANHTMDTYRMILSPNDGHAAKGGGGGGGAGQRNSIGGGNGGHRKSSSGSSGGGGVTTNGSGGGEGGGGGDNNNSEPPTYLNFSLEPKEEEVTQAAGGGGGAQADTNNTDTTTTTTTTTNDTTTHTRDTRWRSISSAAPEAYAFPTLSFDNLYQVTWGKEGPSAVHRWMDPHSRLRVVTLSFKKVQKGKFIDTLATTVQRTLATEPVVIQDEECVDISVIFQSEEEATLSYKLFASMKKATLSKKLTEQPEPYPLRGTPHYAAQPVAKLSRGSSKFVTTANSFIAKRRGRQLKTQGYVYGGPLYELARSLLDAGLTCVSFVDSGSAGRTDFLGKEKAVVKTKHTIWYTAAHAQAGKSLASLVVRSPPSAKLFGLIKSDPQDKAFGIDELVSVTPGPPSDVNRLRTASNVRPVPATAPMPAHASALVPRIMAANVPQAYYPMTVAIQFSDIELCFTFDNEDTTERVARFLYTELWQYQEGKRQKGHDDDEEL